MSTGGFASVCMEGSLLGSSGAGELPLSEEGNQFGLRFSAALISYTDLGRE